jgi:hypothetical protein
MRPVATQEPHAMSRAPRRGRASAARDPMDRLHDEWLGMVRPIDSLVVAKQVLLDAQIARPEGSKELRDIRRRPRKPRSGSCRGRWGRYPGAPDQPGT